MIIVIEGPDGSGKSSVIEYLIENIFKDNYNDVVNYHLPIRDSSVYMKKHLQFGENAFEAQLESVLQQRELFSNLSRYSKNPKNIAILSRSIVSTYVYGYSDFKKLGMKEELIEKFLNALVNFVPKPDCGFILIPDYEVLQQRRKERNNKEENLDIYEKETEVKVQEIYSKYLELCGKIEHPSINSESFWLTPYKEIKISKFDSIKDISININIEFVNRHL